MHAVGSLSGGTILLAPIGFECQDILAELEINTASVYPSL